MLEFDLCIEIILKKNVSWIRFKKLFHLKVEESPQNPCLGGLITYELGDKEEPVCRFENASINKYGIGDKICFS